MLQACDVGCLQGLQTAGVHGRSPPGRSPPAAPRQAPASCAPAVLTCAPAAAQSLLPRSQPAAAAAGRLHEPEAQNQGGVSAWCRVERYRLCSGFKAAAAPWLGPGRRPPRTPGCCGGSACSLKTRLVFGCFLGAGRTFLLARQPAQRGGHKRVARSSCLARYCTRAPVRRP